MKHKNESAPSGGLCKECSPAGRIFGRDRTAHRRAIGLMVVAATLWSIAGVITRHLTLSVQTDGRFEITFWRSIFAALFVGSYFVLVRREGWRPVLAIGWPGLVSG